MKRIEDLTQDDVTKATTEELYKYRLSFCQVFQKRETEGKDTQMMLPGYAFLTQTMRKQGLIWKAQDIDMALFSVAWGDLPEEEEVDIEEVPEEVVDVPAVEKVDVSIISKSDDDDERIVFGIVYEPDVEDTQGDQATAEEIRRPDGRIDVVVKVPCLQIAGGQQKGG